MRTVHSACYRALGLGRGALVTDQLVQHFGSQRGLRINAQPPNPWTEEIYGKTWREEAEGDQLLRLDHLARQTL
ncbi:hypothetical protein, partial [Lactococcus petauri]|uniref:hypothetical protein n=1 Tax=Lactococcus petauri TaxID=1940789 RepID=UPI0021F130BD